MTGTYWLDQKAEPDSHVGFRAAFVLPSAAAVEIRTIGQSWYRGWLNGRWLLEGPLRYALSRPEFDTHRTELPAGQHVLAFHAHYIGAAMSFLPDSPPFLWCRVLVNGEEISLSWKVLRLASHRPGVRRINPNLGWMENCQLAADSPEWPALDYEDSHWDIPAERACPLPEPQPADLGNVPRIEHSLQPLAEGKLATTFGSLDDDPPLAFFLRELDPPELPAKGIWRRYDLGRVRLGSPEFVIEAPPGTIVEIARTETLTNGRVAPWISWSNGLSCNLDRFVLSGGRQAISPLTPKGGRFIEVHIVNASGTAKFLRESFFERTYHPPSEAWLKCEDPLLERIWLTGVETYRACSEDALTDNPTRERAQWIGDVCVGIHIAASAYHDLRLGKRALYQAAQCARKDGLVAGMCPGKPAYLPTFALQWIAAVMEYHRLTGDGKILEDLHAAAERNMQAVAACFAEDGLHPLAGWNFVDWGYKNEEPVDLACNLHYLGALRTMGQWSAKIGRDTKVHEKLRLRLESLLTRILADRSSEGFERLGYHPTALALSLALLPDDARQPALDFLKSHILGCFPNAAHAPRNDSPFEFNHQLITPYFAHYVLPLFIEAGDMDFALEQYRRCWGWMLEEDRTTWMEVFDTRWSHCHHWGGCPTWQLTRYLSGLHPRFDRGPSIFDFRLRTGSLSSVSLRVPNAATGDFFEVRWAKRDEFLNYQIKVSTPIVVRGLPGMAEETRVSGSLDIALPAIESKIWSVS